jgi:cell wall-associated NlpC family hydrolase
MKKSDFVLKALIISLRRHGMERQYMMILLLTWTLLLSPKVRLFAEEPTPIPDTVRYKLVKMARSFLGLPYRGGGMSERRGADCSGLVKMLFAKLHIELPRRSRDQIRSGENIAVESLQSGDLVFFSSDGATPNHVGLYIGNNRFIHAEKKAGHVITTDLNQPWYVQHFFGARRVVEPGKSEQPR